MTKPVAMLTVACFIGAGPTWANARPHHRHHVAPPREIAAPLVLRVPPIVSYDLQDIRASSNHQFVPRPIGAPDRIPLGAADHFGRGVASIGYRTGASRSPVEAHELNAAFSSRPVGFGGAVGGDVSIHF